MKKVIVFLLIIGVLGAIFYNREYLLDYFLGGEANLVVWITIISLSPFVFILYFTIVKPIFVNNRLRKNGIRSIGFIKSMSQTGTMVNNKPMVRFELEVIDEQSELFITEIKEVISLTALAEIQVGTVLPVIYNNRGEVGIDDTPDLEKMQDAIDKYQAIKTPDGLSYDERVEHRKYGVKTLATVTELKPTGEKADDKDVVMVAVEIPNSSGGETKKVSRKIYLSPSLRQYIQLGSLVEVVYVPGKEEKFGIVYPFKREAL
ncbi:hypothetical protein HCB21_08065 [Listeria booriae]|uniref:hypothetical protein n=1 Tax=Listeria booriae TaxID=1552123 RepID=UPI001626295A|nr:hypothetical protein [Listeria booriae]MBC1558629.1 hypothetical protein [Listeria booriae]MBC2037341.1 hypothetical protein [Listeria booriae]MBC2147674.1 hypothetical protein [Listeria booriae]MBC2159718.1 hypothetical protein [Listeria booriae]MBC2162047.1 hypothetical protein [Listeria booriae]